MNPTSKHKFCRRIGRCLWDDAKCPSIKRFYGPGVHGPARRKRKMSTYGELLLEKQKIRNFYFVSEKQLRIAYARSQKGTGNVPEKLLVSLELRLASFVYRAGLAPTIFAARQAVSHGHILVNGKRVDRSSFQVSVGDVVSINAEKSPNIFAKAMEVGLSVPSYITVEKANNVCQATLAIRPTQQDVVVPGEIIKVIEFYAR